MALADLSDERKRVLYRANHRGIKEMDIILGGFAERNIAALDEDKLASFVAFLEEHDRDLILWFTGESPLPDHLDRQLFDQILGDLQPLNRQQ